MQPNFTTYKTWKTEFLRRLGIPKHTPSVYEERKMMFFHNAFCDAGVFNNGNFGSEADINNVLDAALGKAKSDLSKPPHSSKSSKENVALLEAIFSRWRTVLIRAANADISSSSEQATKKSPAAYQPMSESVRSALELDTSEAMAFNDENSATTTQAQPKNIDTSWLAETQKEHADATATTPVTVATGDEYEGSGYNTDNDSDDESNAADEESYTTMKSKPKKPSLFGTIAAYAGLSLLAAIGIIAAAGLVAAIFTGLIAASPLVLGLGAAAVLITAAAITGITLKVISSTSAKKPEEELPIAPPGFFGTDIPTGLSTELGSESTLDIEKVSSKKQEAQTPLEQNQGKLNELINAKSELENDIEAMARDVRTKDVPQYTIEDLQLRYAQIKEQIEMLTGHIAALQKCTPNDVENLNAKQTLEYQKLHQVQTLIMSKSKLNQSIEQIKNLPSASSAVQDIQNDHIKQLEKKSENLEEQILMLNKHLTALGKCPPKNALKLNAQQENEYAQLIEKQSASTKTQTNAPW